MNAEQNIYPAKAEESTISDILLRQHLISQNQYEEVTTKALRRGVTTDSILEEEKIITEKLLERAIAEESKLPSHGQMDLWEPERKHSAALLRFFSALLGRESVQSIMSSFRKHAEDRCRRSLLRRAMRIAKLAEYHHLAEEKKAAQKRETEERRIRREEYLAAKEAARKARKELRQKYWDDRLQARMQKKEKKRLQRQERQKKKIAQREAAITLARTKRQEKVQQHEQRIEDRRRRKSEELGEKRALADAKALAHRMEDQKITPERTPIASEAQQKLEEQIREMQKQLQEQQEALQKKDEGFVQRSTNNAPQVKENALRYQLAEEMQRELAVERKRLQDEFLEQERMLQTRASLPKEAEKEGVSITTPPTKQRLSESAQTEKELAEQEALQLSDKKYTAEEEQVRTERQRIAEELKTLERERMQRQEETRTRTKQGGGKNMRTIEEQRTPEETRTTNQEEKIPAQQETQAMQELKQRAAKRWAAQQKKRSITKGKEKKGGQEEELNTVTDAALDVGEILLKQNYVSEEEYRLAKAQAEERHIPTEHILREQGLVTKELTLNAIAEHFGMPLMDLRSQAPDPAILELLPEDFALSTHSLAIERKQDGTIVVATSQPERTSLLEEIKQILPDIAISLAYAPREAIESTLTFYRKPLQTRFRSIIEQRRKVAPEIIEEIFSDAVQLNASDIHFEPQENIVIVRFRVDGVMHEAGRVPKEFYEGIVNRIKIAGNMRIDEHFSAQDGAIRWKNRDKHMDVRVSIVPIVDGEKIVMRLLSEYVRTLTLTDLGFSPEQREVIVQAAHKPYGMILTTGPTGSGKSTTLYGLLKLRNSPDVNISTIEDPVEYKIPGINHIQVNTRTDLTFDKGLRAIVRQDPDIILVGEIRDNITAQISINAALTGHLVFSTLHANDAATAVPRLTEMDVEPYLLASTLELIMAQRLMRRICGNCRFSFILPHEEACQLFPSAERYFRDDPIITLYRGKGCSSCGQTGYRGRVGVYELLPITQEIEQLIASQHTTTELNTVAREQGMLTLFEDGFRKVKEGVSTIEELLRIAAPPEMEAQSAGP